MNTRTKMILTTLAGTLVLMALHPMGPMGALLWPQPAADAPEPQGVQLPLFLLLFLAEAAVSAFGLAYLLFGRRRALAVLPSRPRLALAAHLSIAFLLMQWWPHGNLHISVPFSFGAILVIDYLFHIPIMVASLTLLAALVAVARQHGAGRGAESPAARGEPLAQGEGA